MSHRVSSHGIVRIVAGNHAKDDSETNYTQEKFAARALLMPTNATATLSPDLAKRVNFERLLPLDGETVVKQRAAWVEEWNRALQGR